MDKIKLITYSVIFIALLVISKISYSYIYDKGYNKGYKDFEDKYTTKLLADKDEEVRHLKESYDKLITQANANQKVEIIYKDRIKTVKEIVKSDNMKCEMTIEQIAKLNEFIKY